MNRYDPPQMPQGEARKYKGFDLGRLVQTVRDLMRGRTNNTTNVTLAAGVATTVLADERIHADVVAVLMPRTASAAAAIGAGVLYCTATVGALTINHDVSGAGDRTFGVAIFG